MFERGPDMFGSQLQEAFRSPRRTEPLIPWHRLKLPNLGAVIGVLALAAVLVLTTACDDSSATGPVTQPADTISAVPPPAAEPTMEERRNACLYAAVVAYPEYVAAGGAYEHNGGKLLMDTLPVCDGVNKAKLRALMTAVVAAPIPEEG